MAIIKIKEEYDGRLPVFNVVKEVVTCDNCNCTKDKVIKTFDSYDEAEEFCNNYIKQGKARDSITPCGEEDPCQ
jgi:hypothetical protein